jgi:hypothetical protein
MKTVARDLFRKQTEMSEGSLGVVEIAEPKSVPRKPEKRRRKFTFLAGAVVLVALAVIGVEVLSSRTQVARQHSQPAAEAGVTVVHPQKASITSPVLPGQTEAYTDAPTLESASRLWSKRE